MSDDLDLPDFLRIPQEERRATWKGRALTKPKAERRRNSRRPQTWSPEAEALEHERTKQKAAKDRAKFQKLREEHPR